MSRLTVVRRRAGAILVTAGLVALALLGVATPASAATSLTASPTGAGTACSPTAPCSAATALSRARAGDTVTLLGGSYGSPTLKGTGGTAANPVVVRPAPGATVSFVKLQTYVPHVAWSGLTVTTVLYVYPQAIGTTVDGFRMLGAGSFVRANDTVVRDSLFDGGVDLDAVQIKDATGVTLEGNVIRDYRLSSASSSAHVDCVQIFDAARVRLVRNALSGCTNSAVILSPGAGRGIQDVVIEGNFIQGCLVVTPSCKGGSAVDLREASASGVVVRGNTIVDGATRVLPRPGLVFDRNVVSYLADCAAPLTRSIVEAWNTGSCAQPARLPYDGNRAGAVPFVDRAAGDLHVLHADSVVVGTDAARLAVGAAIVGFDGRVLRDDTAGADD
jgi:hypothetical protein